MFRRGGVKVAGSSLVRLALVVMTVGLSAPAWADCSDYGLGTWPPEGAPLPKNGRILLEGFRGFQKAVETIGERHPVLVDGAVEVPMRVAEVYVGQFQVTQVVLVPTAPLVVGHRYELRAGPAKDPKFFKLARWRVGLEEDGPLAWTVTEAQETPPAWSAAPKVLGTVHKYYGCGPAVFARFEVSPVAGARYLAEVSPVAGGAVRRALLAPESNGELQVGHGMCRGAFVLKEGVEYSVVLSVVDVAGHVTAAPGPAMRVVGPREP